MTFIFVFLVFALVIAMMAIGVMVHGRSIRGSCGGLNTAGGCSLCSGSGSKSQCQQKSTAMTKPLD